VLQQVVAAALALPGHRMAAPGGKHHHMVLATPGACAAAQGFRQAAQPSNVGGCPREYLLAKSRSWNMWDIRIRCAYMCNM